MTKVQHILPASLYPGEDSKNHSKNVVGVDEITYARLKRLAVEQNTFQKQLLHESMYLLEMYLNGQIKIAKTQSK